MKKFASSFIDFDDTVFDTQKFLTEMEIIFARHGVSSADFRQGTKAAMINGQKFYNYTFEQHVDGLRKKGYSLSDKIIDDLNAILEKNNFQFEGAEHFLEWVCTASEKVILLTAGNPEFQHKKLSSTELTEYFDAVQVLHEKKEEYVRTASNHQKSLFINDNLTENLVLKKMLPEVTVISKTNYFKFNRQDYKESAIPFFETFTDIKKYVETNY